MNRRRFIQKTAGSALAAAAAPAIITEAIKPSTDLTTLGPNYDGSLDLTNGDGPVYGFTCPIEGNSEGFPLLGRASIYVDGKFVAHLGHKDI